MEDIVPVNLLLMANTIQCHDSKLIENVFDLKGSIINRSVTITDEIKPSSTLKDVNLLNLCSDKLFLRFRRKDRKRIMKMMRADIKFLNLHNLMDYSLLLLVENNPDFINAVSRKFTTGNLIKQP
eukprot:CAMPEP_0176344834 /NCGR_PEP_ID=MMETSP0126-20121128/4990_1 /TAXON_ID=141414 ORGANISM="Strombidinopsis acuminatum, Strain SPMC142" /NCGR_SAMPLE_ID=MMETSP0126 /ASSEMBLY_ACC=CAM_ASM_000229 /LENGTH=124 /DNA_ID=CAMNT_0017691479 /DNA_START=1756 /DNA_END=2130 /DNA_ORIENTATION=-